MAPKASRRYTYSASVGIPRCGLKATSALSYVASDFFFSPFGWFKPSGDSGGTANQVLLQLASWWGRKHLWQTNRDKLHSKCIGNADRILEMHFFEIQYIYSTPTVGIFILCVGSTWRWRHCLLVASLAQFVSFLRRTSSIHHKLPFHRLNYV